MNYEDKTKSGTSLVVQWLQIHMPMQGTQVRALIQEQPTCGGAPKLIDIYVCALYVNILADT